MDIDERMTFTLTFRCDDEFFTQHPFPIATVLRKVANDLQPSEPLRWAKGHVTSPAGHTIGEFTLLPNADDYRGSVASEIRRLGHGRLADHVGGWSDEEIMAYSMSMPEHAAQEIIDEAARYPEED